MRITAEDAEKLSEITRLMDEAYRHYFKHSDGHCKSSEGHIRLESGTYFDREHEGKHELTVSIYSYALPMPDGGRSHDFDSIDEALEAVRAAHAEQLATEYDEAGDPVGMWDGFDYDAWAAEYDKESQKKNTSAAAQQPKKRRRILMTGSRRFDDATAASLALTRAMDLLGLTDPDEAVLVHGAARGADTVLKSAAEQLGMSTEAHPADWDAHGRAAGYRRNEKMVGLGADLVLAFPMHPYGTRKTAQQRDISAGTWHCANRAKVAGLPVLVVWGSRLWAYGEAAEQLLGAESADLL